MRHAFEGPTNPQKAPNITSASRIPAPTTNGHSKPPAPSKRPKAVSRTSTAKQADPKDKGKGKATQWDSDEEDDDDEAYVTSNDFAGTPERKRNGVNGFREVGGNDDEEIYG